MSRENVELVKTLQPAGIDLVQVFSDSPDELSSQPEAPFFEDGFDVRFVSGQSTELGNLEAKGIAGFVAAWREWLEPWRSYRVDIDDFIDAGDIVVALVRVQARSARDDVLVHHEPAAVWHIRDGMVTAIHMYLNREDALAAVGLSEEFTQKSK